jgi:DNA uptake protein ComE-like DNA-binding protein
VGGDEKDWVPKTVRGTDAEPRRSTTSDPSEWLPPGADPSVGERAVSAPPPDAGAPREQLTEPEALGREVEAAHQAERGALEARTSAAEAAAREADEARRELELGHAREVDRLASRLAHTESALAEQREEVQRVLEEAEQGAEAYDARIAEIQQQVAGFERAAHKATERMEAATSGGRQDAGGRTELNSVTVEGLRTLGLSITQAARLVAHREATGGFRSAEDVAAVPGLSAAQRQALVERVYVDPTLAGATPR